MNSIRCAVVLSFLAISVWACTGQQADSRSGASGPGEASLASSAEGATVGQAVATQGVPVVAAQATNEPADRSTSVQATGPSVKAMLTIVYTNNIDGEIEPCG